MKSVDKLREFVADINERELNSQIVWVHNNDGSEEVYIKPDFVDGWHRAVDKTMRQCASILLETASAT